MTKQGYDEWLEGRPMLAELVMSNPEQWTRGAAFRLARAVGSDEAALRCLLEGEEG